MARPKKDGTYLNVRIKTAVYERLKEFSEDVGQSKTIAVERALMAYMDDYDKKQRLLKKLEEQND